eukprot:798758_1
MASKKIIGFSNERDLGGTLAVSLHDRNCNIPVTNLVFHVERDVGMGISRATACGWELTNWKQRTTRAFPIRTSSSNLESRNTHDEPYMVYGLLSLHRVIITLIRNIFGRVYVRNFWACLWMNISYIHTQST